MKNADAHQLPPGWAWRPLHTACEVVMGQSPPSTAYNRDGRGLPFFQGKAEFTDLCPDVRVWCDLPGKTAEKDDVLLSVRAPVGPTNLSPCRCTIGRGLCALRPKGGTNPRYLLYALRAFASRLAEQETGTTFGAVSGSQVRDLLIPVAPEETQRAIVEKIEELFSDLDAGVAALERARRNLDRYRASVLKAAVEGRLTERWRAEHPDAEPASELLRRILVERRRRWEADQLAKYESAGRKPPPNWKAKYKDPAPPDAASLPELPRGWCWAKVEQLNPAERPCAYGVLQPGPDVATGVPLVRVGDINDGQIDTTGMKRISPAIAGAYPRTKLRGGEVVLTLVGAIGRTAVVPTALAGANTARAVGVLPLIPLVAAGWVELWFRNPAKVIEMTGLAHEVARKTLNLEDVRRAPVALPPDAEQEQIIAEVERRLSVAAQARAAVKANVDRATGLRQSILKSAFDGSLVSVCRATGPAPANPKEG